MKMRLGAGEAVARWRPQFKDYQQPRKDNCIQKQTTQAMASLLDAIDIDRRVIRVTTAREKESEKKKKKKKKKKKN
jgi:hypothetical protein